MENPALVSGFEYASENQGQVHFIGLVSDAGVHSDHTHLHALIEMAADRDLEAVTHAITDGRDTRPTSAREYLDELASVTTAQGTGEVATINGRYFAMDRDENWERTYRVYSAIVNREAPHRAESAIAALDAAYDRGETDEFIEPTLIADRPAVADGDAVICVNFRADRMRQLVRMLADIDPDWPYPTAPPGVRVVTMTEYDERFALPVAFPARQPPAVFGQVLATNGKTQLRLAETEKYAHVTYFLNGGRETVFEGERREIVPSPAVATYDEQPAMSAVELTDEAIRLIEAEDPDVLVLNYANPDMVGHTGDYEAAVAAVEVVDAQLGRLVDFLLDRGVEIVVTADHGNADDMGSEAEPHTAHTRNPVPFIYLAADETDGGKRVRDGGELSDIAPTLLSLLSLETPAAMTGESLLT